MFKVSPAILQTFIDTPNCVLEDHVQYNTLHIPNVFCDGYLQIISCVGIVIVRCTETFGSPCIKQFTQQTHTHARTHTHTHTHIYIYIYNFKNFKLEINILTSPLHILRRYNFTTTASQITTSCYNFV